MKVSQHAAVRSIESLILAGERVSKIEITYKGIISEAVKKYLDMAYKLGYIRGYIIECNATVDNIARKGTAKPSIKVLLKAAALARSAA